MSLTEYSIEDQERAAHQGNIEAQYQVGKYYYEADFFNADEDKAFYWLKAASEQGSVDAECLLGGCYLHGTGVEENEKIAFDIFQTLAEQGHSKAQYYLGYCHHYGCGVNSDKTLAELWLIKSASSNDPEAENLLGELHYDHGYGNLKEAEKWYLLAAEHKNDDAYLSLAHLYEKGGEGITQDYERAFFWWNKMASEGSWVGSYHVGIYHLFGLGISKNSQKAYSWFELAADRGRKWSYGDPFYMLAACQFTGLAGLKSKGQAVATLMDGLSVTYSSTDKSVTFEQYETFALYKLAKEYITYGFKQGSALLSQTATEGLLLAQKELALNYYFGRYGFEKDMAKAYHWYTLASAQGDEHSIQRCKEIENRFPDVVPVHKPKSGRSIDASGKAIDTLNELIGLGSVKKRVQALVNEIKLRKERIRRGLPTGSPRSYHMLFTGNPGTGKTIVARLVAEIFYDLGLTKENKIIETDRSGLVAEYVGHTAPKTNEVIDSAKGGVLFIDEAYALKGEGNDFGKEAIETLLKRMEDDRENLIVIAAGYTEDMKDLLDSNAGLASRFTRTIHFDDYSIHELLEIFEKIANDNGYHVNKNSFEIIDQKLGAIKEEKGSHFGNGREVRNLFEYAIQEQEDRICNGVTDISSMHNDDLQTLIPDDFYNLATC